MSDTPSWDERALRGATYGFALLLPISISMSEPLALIALALWVVQRARRDNPRNLRTCPYFAPILLFSTVALVASIAGARPDIAISKCHRLLLFGMPFLMADALRPGRDAEAGGDGLERVALLFVLGTTLLAVHDMVRVPVQVWRGARLFDTGNMRDPQLYLVSLCLLAALGLLGLGRVRRGLWLAAAALNGAGLVIHFKRGVWASFVIAMMLTAMLTRKWRTAAGVLVCVAAFLAVPQVRDRLGLLREEWSVHMGGRYVLWTRVAPALLRENPWGMGLGAPRHADFAARARYVQPKLNHLHNNLLEVALETGWLGLGAWLWWMATTAIVLLRSFRRASAAGVRAAWVALGGLAAFSGLMVNGLVEYNFGDGEVLMTLCFIMGLSCILWDRFGAEPGRAVA